MAIDKTRTVRGVMLESYFRCEHGLYGAERGCLACQIEQDGREYELARQHPPAPRLSAYGFPLAEDSARGGVER
jgi:hypothetical protein